jgi:hypothetical protein
MPERCCGAEFFRPLEDFGAPDSFADALVVIETDRCDDTTSATASTDVPGR